MIARGVKEINHFEFVDNTLLIGGDSRIIAQRFKKVLETFCLASGRKINKFKAIIWMEYRLENTPRNYKGVRISMEIQLGLIQIFSYSNG